MFNKLFLSQGILYLLVAFFCLTIIPSAHAAEIKGSTLNSANGLYLEGVRISIEGTGIVIFSERGGSFTIRNLKPGDYTLKATYIGYPVYTQNVNVPNQESSIRITIDYADKDIIELEEFSVEGTLVGQAKAINLQRSADNVMNVISSDAIGQFVDRNAAEALQRLPGITLEESQGEGKFIIIRGANPSFNAVTVDGVTVATPEEDGRSTGLDIISTDQLERIEVVKSWLPDSSGNVIGGTVNLITRSALDRGERFASVDGAFVRYAIAASDSHRFNATYGDILGKKRNIGFQISYNKAVDNRGSDTLRANNWQTVNPVPLIDAPVGFFMGGLRLEDYTIRRERTNFGGKLEYRLNENHSFYFSASFNKKDDDEVLQETRVIVDTGGTFYTKLSKFTEDVALDLGFDPTDPEVAARINGSAETGTSLHFHEAEQLGDIAWDPVTQNFTFIGGNGRFRKTWQNTVTEDEILTYQVGGKSRLLDWLQLDYKYYVTEAEKNWTEREIRLDTDSFATESVPGDEDYFPHALEDTDVGFLTDPESYRLNVNRGRVQDNAFFSSDSRIGFEVNMEATYRIGNFTARTKFGIAFDYREKEFIRDFNRFSDIDTSAVDQLTLADPMFLVVLWRRTFCPPGPTTISARVSIPYPPMRFSMNLAMSCL